MVKKTVLTITLFFVLLVMSSTYAVAASKAAPSPQGWKADWNKTVAAARQEGKVVIFATVVKNTQNDIRNTLMKEFGIEPEFRVMSGAEFATQLFAERRAGIHSTDLFMGGMSTLYSQFKPAGALDSLKDILILPEVTDGSKWYDGKLNFIDKDDTILAFGATAQSYIAINTEKVKPGEITGYRDLLDPKWKGQIVINDPTIAGRGLDWFQVMTRLMGMDYLQKLLTQEPMVTRDRRLQAEWVARGKYAIGVALDTSTVQQFIKDGAPLKMVWPKEGIQLGAEKGGLALINQAPHPNAAKVFVNWLLSKEGQTLWSRDEGLQSARNDVPADFLPADQVRDPNKKYITMEQEEWYATKNKSKELATQMFSRFIH